MPHPLVDSGSVNPVLLQGMMIVLLFIWYVGVQVGSSVGTVVQPLWLQPGGWSPGGGNTEPGGAGGQRLGQWSLALISRHGFSSVQAFLRSSLASTSGEESLFYWKAAHRIIERTLQSTRLRFWTNSRD